MPRLPRLFVPGYPQHVIQRGNNRQVCFFSHQDYAVYLDKLREAAQKFKVDIHAFVLMTNHVHLLMTGYNKDDISQVMQSLGRYYVHYVNKSYNRTGTLWEGRYKSTLVDTEYYLLKLHQYIELNPVRAGMVAHPAEYPWSSYQHNAGIKRFSLITFHERYLALGDCQMARRQAYLALFEQQLSDNEMDSIRDATNKAWILSSERFVKQIKDRLNRRPLPKPRGGDHRSAEFKNTS